MGSAADAILNVTPAPQARPSPAAPAQADRDASDFQDYVDAASDARDAEETPRAEAKPRRRAETEQHSDESAAQIIAAPTPPSEAPAQPLILQVVASVTPQAPTVEAPAQAASPTPPTQAPTVAPPTQQNAASATPTSDAQPITPVAAPPNASPEKGKAPATETQSAQATSEQSVVAEAPAPTQPQAAQPVQVVQAPIVPATLVTATTKPPAAPSATDATTQLSALEAGGESKPQAALTEGKTKASPQDGKKAPLAPAPTPNATPTQSNANEIARNVANLLAPDVQQSAPAPAAPTPAQPIGLVQPGAAQQPQTALETTAKQATPVQAQIGREIIRRFNGESTSFTLRLDPAELGRVDVRLEVSRDHRVTAVVQADNPQALAELSRNARDLEQALQSAGLQLTENGLSFDLSDRRGAFAAQDKNTGGARGIETAAATPDEPQAIARPIGLEQWRGVRVDLVA